MTLEEKAEEYARKTKKVDWEGFDVDKEARKEGYIAGAIENGVVWHDLRKNPDDLPPLERGSYTANVLVNNGDIAFYDYDDGCWIGEPVNCEIAPPIAWCEIPTFGEVVCDDN